MQPEDTFLETGLEHFTLKKSTKIHELRSILYELEHPCGAQVMHLANEDQENLFSLNFQTLPKSDDGVAHILEHTVLCGSKKFPIKDPFFGMIRRSLNTFMNAMTGPDFTCYPAASQVEADFYNLLEVYLDAVFHPLLNRLSFLQEGHRLEFQNPEDSSSDLVYRGIVFNEMKGSLSSPDTRIWHAINQALMPDLPYAFNSGGDPKEIPNLTYDEFLEFHKNYYHPSRCLFYFYGNLPLVKHLRFLEEKVLKDAEKLTPLPHIKEQKRFSKPKHVLSSYASSDKDLSSKTFIGFAWLSANIQDQEDVLALLLLDSILMDTDASALKDAFLQSKLVRAADAFIDVDMSEIPYFILLRGTEEAHLEKLKKLLFQTLEQLAEKGIDSKLIQSSLHQLEFSRSEITGDYQPFGLSLFFRSALPKMHGCEAENSLVIHSLFEKLLEKTKNPDYLPGIIRKYFLDNPHFVSCVMKPDLHLNEEENKREKETLSQLKKKLTEKQKEQIINQTKELKAFQAKSEHEDMNCLPKIAVSQIPKENPYFELEIEKKGDYTLYHHDCFTNHILYVNLIYSLPKLTRRQLQYTRLFAYLFGELGCRNRSYKENLEKVHAFTGGISASLGSHVQCKEPDLMKPAIHIRGKALLRNIPKLIPLMLEMCNETRFDEKERIKELLLQLLTQLENRVNTGALSYASDLALCNNSKSAKLHHLWYGISYFQFIKEITTNLDEKLDEIIHELQALKPLLLHANQLDVVLSCSKEEKAVLEANDFYGLSSIKKHPFVSWECDFDVSSIPSHARVNATQVAFTAKGFKTVAQPSPDAPYLSLASTLLENKVLHKKIREAGGAYGSGAHYNTITGSFYMHSYRDPHIANTLETFDSCFTEILENRFTEEDLEEAKLSIIQGMDTPVSPGSRGNITYHQLRDGRTKEIRQRYRSALLQAECKHVKEAVEKHLLDFAKNGVTVTFCEKALIEKENEKMKDKLPIYAIDHVF